MLANPPPAPLPQETLRVQPSAGQDLPHTRTGAVHWIVTATALAGVLGASTLVQPSDATATPAHSAMGSRSAPAPSPAPADAPDPAKVRFPVDCGPEKLDVIKKASSDLDGDGRAETVAVVRCHAGFGTPPSGIYVLAHPAVPGVGPRIVETFLDPKEGISVMDFAVRGRTVTATLLGYSSEDVPRCCPDRRREVKWHWADGKFKLTAAPVPGSV